MAVLAGTAHWYPGWRAIVHSIASHWRYLWRKDAKVAFPGSGDAQDPSAEEFAAYLLFIAAHI